MEAVFVLSHGRYDDEPGADAKLIGIYRTHEAAEAAASRLTTKPGFSDHPTDWVIDRYKLDEDHWTEGFVTVTSADL